MKNTGTLQVTTPSQREIVLTRVFDAPRRLVFDALTRPELITRWFGPRGFTVVTCEVDLRVGGAWRYVIRDPSGQDMAMWGTYREIAAPDRLVHTEFMEGFEANESIVTTLLAERAGKTTLTATVLYDSKETRDAVLTSGMEHGAAETYDKLAEILSATSAKN